MLIHRGNCKVKTAFRTVVKDVIGAHASYHECRITHARTEPYVSLTTWGPFGSGESWESKGKPKHYAEEIERIKSRVHERGFCDVAVTLSRKGWLKRVELLPFIRDPRRGFFVERVDFAVRGKVRYEYLNRQSKWVGRKRDAHLFSRRIGALGAMKEVEEANYSYHFHSWRKP